MKSKVSISTYASTMTGPFSSFSPVCFAESVLVPQLRSFLQPSNTHELPFAPPSGQPLHTPEIMVCIHYLPSSALALLDSEIPCLLPIPDESPVTAFALLWSSHSLCSRKCWQASFLRLSFLLAPIHLHSASSPAPPPTPPQCLSASPLESHLIHGCPGSPHPPPGPQLQISANVTHLKQRFSTPTASPCSHLWTSLCLSDVLRLQDSLPLSPSTHTLHESCSLQNFSQIGASFQLPAPPLTFLGFVPLALLPASTPPLCVECSPALETFPIRNPPPAPPDLPLPARSILHLPPHTLFS